VPRSTGVIDDVRVGADRLQRRAPQGFRRRPRPAGEDRDPLLARAIGRARAGDEHAVRYIYLAFRDHVYGYVCSIVRDEHEAEDVTQQVFARLPGALARYEPRAVPFSGWILRVAHNAAVDHLRLHRPLPAETVRPLSEPDGDDAHTRFQDLHAALETLPPDQRLVIVLRFVVGLSPSEVAVRMGRSPDAIHGLQHRARRTLKGELLRLRAGPAAMPPPAS
jgi:RNA polymerase sigma-70 factor (ECF subfamily)